MEKYLSILLVEDDNAVCKKFVDLIDQSDFFSLAGVTNNSIKAIELTKDTQPDAIILDLELHQGSGSGLDVLRELKSLPLAKKPFVLITTNNTSPTTFRIARQFGADFILTKYQDNYSEKYVLDFIRSLPSVKKNTETEGVSSQTSEEQSPAFLEQRVKRQILAEFDNIGIKRKFVGHRYLIEAVIMTIQNPRPNISSYLAVKHDKTESSVERAMQNAINRAWSSTDVDELHKYYTARISSIKGVPTLTEFIYYYANKFGL